MTFQSGFVNIVGLPNVGKSSLINFLLDEKLSIVNSKSQTTRQNIKGFIHGNNHQIILVDTPGYIDTPAYQLQLTMNSYIDLALEESDIVLLVVDKYQRMDATHPLIQAIRAAAKPTILVVNKLDETTPEEVQQLYTYYHNHLSFTQQICISVKLSLGKNELIQLILKHLPIHPPYYSGEEWTDRNMRFFASEIIREKIFSTYKKEVPYSTEVVITKYQEREGSDYIEATIYVERESQKAIIIGHNAEKLKQISMDARREIETYTDTKVHLFIFVKVLADWRNKDNLLEKLGYYHPNKK